jgi:hypothetical protein
MLLQHAPLQYRYMLTGFLILSMPTQAIHFQPKQETTWNVVPF